MTTLVGVESIGGVGNQVFASDGDFHAYAYLAAADGTLGELRLQLGSGTQSFTSVLLAVYSMTFTPSLKPDELLDFGTYSGPATPSTELMVSGLSVPIVEGTYYWLAVIPIGGAMHYRLDFEGEFQAVPDPPDTYTAFPDPCPAVDLNTDGVPAFWGTTAAEPEEPVVLDGPGLEFHVTGLWYPEETEHAYYGRAADPQAGEVFIPLNDSRTASVTVPLTDTVLAGVLGHPYSRFLRVYHRKRLVFWGPINLHEVDMRAGTCKLSAVDPSLRLLRHQLRRGDLLDAPVPLAEANDDEGAVTIDHVGLRHLRDAGLNTTEQTTRGVPDLGIIDGTNTYVADPDSRFGVSRADEVWGMMLTLSRTEGPDFELEPVDDEVGAYCKLNTFARQGTDRSHAAEDVQAVQFHYGGNRSNVENLAYTDGSQYTTHVHVQPRDGGYRFTAANLTASAETGPYVDWVSGGFDSQKADSIQNALQILAHANDYVAAYGRPLLALTLTLPAETGSADEYQYGRDFWVGDTVGVSGKSGVCELEESAYRIVSVRLVQEGATVRPDVTVIADRVAALDDETTDEED